MSAPAFVRAVPPGRPLALFVGAMAKGPDDFADGLVDQKISLSRHALSASVVCAKVRTVPSSARRRAGEAPAHRGSAGAPSRARAGLG